MRRAHVRRRWGALFAAAAALFAVAPPATADAAPGPEVQWLHVERPLRERAFIADESGREVILRGTNVTGIYQNHDDDHRNPGHPHKPVDPAAYDGECPENTEDWSNPPICQVDAGEGPWVSAADDSRNDLAQMRALGFNAVRLCVSWGLVEPEPGRYDDAYVERIAQVVGWAKEQGMHVLVDFHQDQYGDVPRTPTLNLPPLFVPPSGQNDGAPRWAVMTDGIASFAFLGQNVLNPAVVRAFDHFWRNDVPTGAGRGDAPGPGLQDHFIGAFARVVDRLADEPAVAGFEIMNEPQPGTYDAARFNREALYPFYRRVIQAVTGVRDSMPDCPAERPTGPDCAYPDLGIRDTRHLIVFEPNAVRNLVDFAPGPHFRFSEYPNLVYGPHVYSYRFTVPSALGVPRMRAWWPPSNEFAFSTAEREAVAMGAALFVGEFAGFTDDEPIIAAQERHAVGGTQWDWKYNCLSAEPCDEAGAWSVYESGGPGPDPAHNGPLKQQRVRTLSRVLPRATAGRLRGYSYDPARGTFRMRATGAAAVGVGDRDHETWVTIPPHVTGPVSVEGDAVLDAVETHPDGTRSAYVAPDGRGDYSVSVG